MNLFSLREDLKANRDRIPGPSIGLGLSLGPSAVSLQSRDATGTPV